MGQGIQTRQPWIPNLWYLNIGMEWYESSTSSRWFSLRNPWFKILNAHLMWRLLAGSPEHHRQFRAPRAHSRHSELPSDHHGVNLQVFEGRVKRDPVETTVEWRDTPIFKVRTASTGLEFWNGKSTWGLFHVGWMHIPAGNHRSWPIMAISPVANRINTSICVCYFWVTNNRSTSWDARTSRKP